MVATGRSCQPENDIARLKQADQISQIHCQKLSIKSSVKTLFLQLLVTQATSRPYT